MGTVRKMSTTGVFPTSRMVGLLTKLAATKKGPKANAAPRLEHSTSTVIKNKTDTTPPC